MHSGHNYKNSSIIVDLAVEQIPRSTERISSIIYIIRFTVEFLHAICITEVYEFDLKINC